jgi:septum formation inhibitor MinC
MSEKLPKKPQRNKGSKKITLNNAKRWKDIVEGVDKRQVPISILQNIEVKLVDGTKIDIDVKKLIQEGMDPTEIEEMLDDKFNQLDAYIENVDFLIDIEKVVTTVQPETDKVLKGL